MHHRPAVLVHRPRARHLRAASSTRSGWLRRKLLAARFVVTCTEANVRHLRGDRAAGARPPRLPRPLGRLHDRCCRPAASAAAAQRPPARARRRPARGQEGLRRAGRRVRRPARARRAVRRADRRPGRQATATRCARRIAALGSPVRLPGPDRPGGAAARVPPRRARCACRAGCCPTDRDGIPNVLVEAMAAGAPVVATAVSGIPELVEHERQRPARRARGPRGARRRAAAPARRPRAARAGSRRTAARPCASASTASASPASSPSCSGRRCRMTADRVRHGPCCASPSTSTATARWPRPSPPGASRFAGETRELGLEPDWLDADAARRRGVADRLGQVLLRARPRGRVPRRPASRASSTRGSGWSASFIRQVPPDHDPSEVTARRILNWIYAWQRLPEAVGPSTRRCVESIARAGAPRARRPHRRSATTARSSSTRC